MFHIEVFKSAYIFHLNTNKSKHMFIDVTKPENRAKVKVAQGSVDYNNLYDNYKVHQPNITPSYTDFVFHTFERAIHPKYAAGYSYAIKLYDPEDPILPSIYPFVSKADILAIEVATHVHISPEFDEFNTGNQNQIHVPEATIIVDWFLDNSGKDRRPAVADLYSQPFGVLGLPKVDFENWSYRRIASKVYNMGAFHGNQNDSGLDAVTGYQVAPTPIPPPTVGAMVMPTAYMAFGTSTTTFDHYHLDIENCPQYIKVGALSDTTYESKCNNIFFTVRCSSKNEGPLLGEHYQVDMTVRLYWRKWSSGYN